MAIGQWGAGEVLVTEGTAEDREGRGEGEGEGDRGAEGEGGKVGKGE